MHKIVTVLLSILALASCANQYTIEGTSNVSTLDGRMLYLKVLKNNEFKTIDSCDVLHGQFRFNGIFDTICIASIFMDEESVLPLVLEKGKINIKIDDTQQTVSGTPMNDELFAFFNKYSQLKNQEAELIHTHDRAIMDGSDMEAVTKELANEAQRIAVEEDRLVTTFVTDNFDNILGPGVFLMVTIDYIHPQLTPWIEDIMSKATDKFKNDPYVKDYYQKAQENQEIMNGLRENGQTTTPQAVPDGNMAAPQGDDNGGAGSHAADKKE